MTNNHSLENVAVGGQPLPCFLGTQQMLWHTNSSHRTTQKKPMGKGFRKEVKVLSLDHMVLSNLISSWVGWKENYWNGKDHRPMTVKWPEIHSTLIIPLTLTAHLLSMWGGVRKGSWWRRRRPSISNRAIWEGFSENETCKKTKGKELSSKEEPGCKPTAA